MTPTGLPRDSAGPPPALGPRDHTISITPPLRLPALFALRRASASRAGDFPVDWAVDGPYSWDWAVIWSGFLQSTPGVCTADLQVVEPGFEYYLYMCTGVLATFLVTFLVTFWLLFCIMKGNCNLKLLEGIKE